MIRSIRTDAVAWLFIACGPGLFAAAPAKAEWECQRPLRNGALPVFATRFEFVNGDALPGKLTKKVREAFQKDVAWMLAEHLQCIDEVRFVDWQPWYEVKGPVAGTVYASITQEGESPDEWIKLHLDYSLTGSENPIPLISLSDELFTLYRPKQTQGPGDVGQFWRARLSERFGVIWAGPARQPLRSQLAERLIAVGLPNKDVEGIEDQQRVRLSLARKDLEAAEDRTILRLSIQPKSGREQNLKMHPTCTKEEQILARIVEIPWSQASRFLQDRDGTALWLERYQWEDPLVCRTRFERPGAH